MQTKRIVSQVNIVKLVLIVMIIPGWQSCIMTSNGFTGRTLERGEINISPAFDYLVISDKDQTRFGFYPSFGADFGIPLRSEIGIKYYPLTFFKGSLRTQLTPRDFDNWQIGTTVDINYTSIDSWPLIPFFRITAGYNTDITRPFINLSYSPIKIYDRNGYFQFGVGAGIPLGPKENQTVLIPELMIGSRDEYMLSFGLGFRLPLGKQQKK